MKKYTTDIAYSANIHAYCPITSGWIFASYLATCHTTRRSQKLYEGGCKRCQDRASGKIASGEGLGRCLCNHAEANAIMHCAIMGIEAGAKGAVLYTTLSPCLECSKMAITIGIRRFVCLEEYPETDNSLLKDAGVHVDKIDSAKISHWAKMLFDKGANS